MDMSLAIEYFIFVALTAFATLQIVAAVKNKERLRILRDRNLTLAACVIIIAASFIWFFSTRDRNVQTYMEGAQISLIFGLGAFASTILTKILKAIHESNRS